MHSSVSTQEPRAETDGNTVESDSQRPVPCPARLGVAAALMTAGWSHFDRLYEPPRPYFAAGAALLGVLVLGVSLIKRGRSRFLVFIQLLAVGTLCVLCLASVDRVLVSAESRGHPWEVFAHAVTPLLNIQGYPAAAERGALYVDHPEGLVTILPSSEKLGLRPLAELWCLWIVLHIVLDGRRILDVGIVGAITLFLIVFVRFAACVFMHLEHAHILVGSSGFDALSLFSSPAVGAATLIASGLLLDFVRRRLLGNVTFELPCDLTFRSIAFYFAGSLGIAMLIGFAGTCEPPGRQKSGRVLFDDRFCGVWEPTARLLDTDWYGDFSTYSFSSLGEWLGHWFIVDVNTQRPYTDELLGQYDILVLKTPVLPIPEAEREAIDRFVTAGGGLLLVGDHTNLLGMGTHLNSLCDRYGLRFRYDSVSDATTGGFVDYFGPFLGRHVAAMNLDHLQFMTSCSLELDSRAEPIVVARSCRRDPHDYANSSFFGRTGPHPELAHGSTVLAASVQAGKGRIAAFTDSTVWSSFAVFQFDREKLAAGIVCLLNREQSSWTLPLRASALVVLVLAIIIGRSSMRTGATLPLCLGGFLGVWSGIFGADRVHQALYDLGPPRSPIHEVSFLWQGGSCAFPPVLGGIGSLPLDRAFDTLLVSVQRLGLVPRVAYTYDDDLFTESTRALFVIAPVDRAPRSTMSRIESFVRGGGSLIVLDDGRLEGGGSAGEYMRMLGIDVRYTRQTGPNGEPGIHSALSGLTELNYVPSHGTFVGHRAFGAGHVVYMREASDFSRVGMGHCFARPGKLARARYDTVFWLLRDVLRLAGDDRRYYGFCE